MTTESDDNIRFGYDGFDQTEPSQQASSASSYPPGYAAHVVQPPTYSNEALNETSSKPQSTTGSKVYLSLAVIVIVVPLVTLLLAFGIIPYGLLSTVASFLGLFAFLCYPGAIVGLVVGITCIRKAKKRNQRRINWGIGLTMMGLQVAVLTAAIVYLSVLLSSYDGY
jgi:hypothetical protein